MKKGVEANIFRIQRERSKDQSRSKIHSEQSAEMSQLRIDKQQTVRQQSDHIKKRRFTTQQAGGTSPSHNRFKRIQNAYKINFDRKNFPRHRSTSIKLKTPQRVEVSNLHPKDSSGMQMPTVAQDVSYREKSRSSPKIINQTPFKEYYHKKKFIAMQSSKNSLQRHKNTIQTLSRNSSEKVPQNKLPQTTRKGSLSKIPEQKLVYRDALKQYKAKNTIKALKLFKQLLYREPRNCEYLYFTGSCLLNQGSHKESIKYLIQAQSLNKQFNSHMYLYLAINHKTLGKLAEAVKWLEVGVRCFPDFEEGIYYLGKLNLKLKNYKKSIESFREVLNLNPDNMIVYSFLAEAYTLQGDLDSAEKTYKTFISSMGFKKENEQQKKTAHLKLVQLLIKQRKWNDSQLRQSIEYLIKADSENLEAVYLKAYVFYQIFNEESEERSSVKLWLEQILSNDSPYTLTIKAIKLLFRVEIDKKDMYAAQEVVNRCERLGIDLKHYEQWKLLIQSANDAMKRKNSEAKQKITGCRLLLSRSKARRPEDQAEQSSLCLTSEEVEYLEFQAELYLAYVLFSLEEISESVEVYQKIQATAKEHCSIRTQQSLRYNCLMGQAVRQHQINEDYFEAKDFLEEAMNIRQSTEAIFIWVINEIAIIKKCFESLEDSEELKEQPFSSQRYLFENPLEQLSQAESQAPKQSLLYFYHSLILLYLTENESALQKIDHAISRSEEPVSEYHYIKALCLFLIAAQTDSKVSAMKGLEEISRSIDIDGSIPQFFKERSKHLYCLKKYELAIQDCSKAINDGETDEQSKILSMFYFYVVSDYAKAEKLLAEMLEAEKAKRVIDRDVLSEAEFEVDHKYKDFQYALMLRTGQFERTGPASELLVYLTKDRNNFENQLISKPEEMYIKSVQKMIDQRYQYSEFTVYYINLLLACYYCDVGHYQQSLNKLFACLEQIQEIISEKNKARKSYRQKRNDLHAPINIDNTGDSSSDHSSEFKIDCKDDFSNVQTEDMLNEIKYNIVIVTLFRQSQGADHVSNQNLSAVFGETLNFIEGFEKDTQSEDLLDCFEIIKKLIDSPKDNQQSGVLEPQNTQRSPQKIRRVDLHPFKGQHNLSNYFPHYSLKIGTQYQISTSLLVFYPAKLRFNIKPEFDESFLFNFDIDKVEFKLLPPWFRLASAKNDFHSKSRGTGGVDSSKPEMCYKRSQAKTGNLKQQLLFTDKIRNVSINLTETDRSPSALNNERNYQHEANKSKNRYKQEKGLSHEQMSNPDIVPKSANESCTQIIVENKLKKIIRLDSEVQKKLKKMLL